MPAVQDLAVGVIAECLAAHDFAVLSAVGVELQFIFFCDIKEQREEPCVSPFGEDQIRVVALDGTADTLQEERSFLNGDTLAVAGEARFDMQRGSVAGVHVRLKR